MQFILFPYLQYCLCNELLDVEYAKSWPARLPDSLACQVRYHFFKPSQVYPNPYPNATDNIESISRWTNTVLNHLVYGSVRYPLAPFLSLTFNRCVTTAVGVFLRQIHNRSFGHHGHMQNHHVGDMSIGNQKTVIKFTEWCSTVRCDLDSSDR
jgi:hypothetical protein